MCLCQRQIAHLPLLRQLDVRRSNGKLDQFSTWMKEMDSYGRQCCGEKINKNKAAS